MGLKPCSCNLSAISGLIYILSNNSAEGVDGLGLATACSIFLSIALKLAGKKLLGFASKLYSDGTSAPYLLSISDKRTLSLPKYMPLFCSFSLNSSSFTSAARSVLALSSPKQEVTSLTTASIIGTSYLTIRSKCFSSPRILLAKDSG